MLLFTSLLLADELHASKKAEASHATGTAHSIFWKMADEKTVAALKNWRKERNPMQIALSRPQIAPR